MIEPYYKDSDCTLYCGKCEEILPQLNIKADLCLTDPPYGIAYSSGHGSSVWGDGSIHGDEDTKLRDFVLQQIGDMTAIVFGTWRIPRPVNTRTLLVWDTLGALGMGNLEIPWKPSHQEIYILGDTKLFCGSRDSDVIRCPPVQSMAKNGRLHPLEKPVALIQELICKTTASLILDPFAGSGTTLVAAKLLKRKSIGIEMSPKYCEIIVNRLNKPMPLFDPIKQESFL